MEGSARIGRRTLVAGATLAALTVGACGGQRQDANEPSGTFRVAVVRSSFPAKQHLAKSERMVISVKNTGSKAVPDLAVTVDSFSAKSEQPDLADPSRAVWIIDKVMPLPNLFH